MNLKDSFTPERIADRLMIQEVMHRWARAVDRLDVKGMRAVFHPDAIDNHGDYVGDPEGLITWILERHTKIPFSAHILSNMLIEFAGPDLALVETTATIVQRNDADGDGQAAPNGTVFMGVGRYVDRFQRRNGEWRIFRRKVISGVGAFSPAPKGLPLSPAYTLSRRDKEDWVYQERAALGLID